MSGINENRVVIVTGAGNGIGRAHALSFAREGARVVVNDLGGSRDGSGTSTGPAHAVVDEIVAAGGTAVANTSDISTFEGGAEVVQQAIDTFGGLDVLVNNAGILRDKMLVNMTESDWDAVIKVHLKGTFAPSHAAATYWRAQSKAGSPRTARIINTSSPSGIFGNVGQTNYGAAKAGIAAFTLIAAMELGNYGVTVNAIAPTALTRMTEDLATQEWLKGGLPTAEAISPLVVWLGSAQSTGITGRVFSISGGIISVNEGWVSGPTVENPLGLWEAKDLGTVIPDLVLKAAPNANMLGERT